MADSRPPAPVTSPSAAPAGPRADEPDTGTTRGLLPRASHGDPEALERLVERIRRYLVRVSRGRLPGWARDEADTEDIVQDALRRSLPHLPRFRDQSLHDLRRWLHTVVRNLITDQKRRAGRRGATEPLLAEFCDPHPGQEQRLAHTEETRLLDGACQILKPRERKLIACRLERGCSFGQLAEELRYASPDAARMAYHRALRKVRDEMRRVSA